MLSLAAMIPMMAGRIDLTVGYGIVLWHILAIALQTQLGLPGRSRWSIVLLGRLPARAAQRPAGRDGADRLLHRHARHRHRPLRDRALVHRGPAGRSACCRRASPASTPPASSACRSPPTTCWSISLVLVDRHRVPADRPLPLRHRRQSARGGAQRHPEPALRHRRLRRLGPARRRRRRRAGRAAAHRPGERRPRVPAAGPGRRLPRLDHDQARARQRLGHHRRRGDPRRRHIRHPADRRRVLRRAAVQRRDAADRHRPRRLRPAAPRPVRHGTRRKPSGGRRHQVPDETSQGRNLDDEKD